ncbi:hypothetical protein JCM3770_007050 [Rhodotorula araucariae]
MADDAHLASLQAATNLSLGELADLSAVATSSPRFGATGDELIARNLWRDELRRHAATLMDRRLALDLQQALREDRTIEAVRRSREVQELRRQARASAGGTVTATPETRDDYSEDCYVCSDGHDKRSVRVDCGHLYCFPCLRQLCLLATKDETLNPASCCKQAINPLHFTKVVTPRQHTAYLDALKEFNSLDRVYCANPRCSAFLCAALNQNRTLATCSQCLARTCQACRGPWHLSDKEPCAAEADDVAASKLAQLVRGVRCPTCHRVVMRNGGCAHV